MRAPPALLIAVLLASPAAAAPAAKAPAQVTIYRCTDAAGRLSLRDSPCRAGEHQEARSMLRPTDAPPRARSARERGPAVLPPTRIVYRTAPRPVYACTTPDGARYTSASPEGNPRWMPLWAAGYPVPVYGPVVEGGYGGSVERRQGGTVIRVDAGRRWQSPGWVAPVAVVPGGTWVRDACTPLPAGEACALLRDRREALDRRWFSALQGDRDAISREQRQIDAELAETCS